MEKRNVLILSCSANDDIAKSEVILLCYHGQTQIPVAENAVQLKHDVCTTNFSVLRTLLNFRH